ncbi:MAG: hypothetical protein QME52_02115 [Bacteroidota bacterium]|nr:hypothetical protein [Bacteroidota bacterium]
MRYIKSLVTLLLLLLLIENSGRSQIVQDSSLAIILERAYSLLDNNPNEAERLFEKAISLEPMNVVYRRQLGYLYNSLQKYDLALRQFYFAESLNSSDTIKLQIAYTYSLMGQKEKAEKILKELESSSSQDIREKAKMELGGNKDQPSHWWTHIYTAAFYDTRWETSFLQTDMKSGYFLTDDKILSGFGFIMLSGDARSHGGLAPVIISDNSLIFGLGINIKPLEGFQINIQDGLAFDLIAEAALSKPKNDFRAVAIYSYGIYPKFTYNSGFKTPYTPFADIYTSVGYYSRYQNSIWYLQGRFGYRIIEASYTAFDIYSKGNLVRDTGKEFYNNLVEGGIGIQVIPNIEWGVYLSAEYDVGQYLNYIGSPNPYKRYYSMYRFFIIFERSF